MLNTVRRLALTAVAGLTLSGCSSDPAVWEAVAVGLNNAADEMAWENANCYWAPPPGAPLAANQRFCPGDYGYRDIQLPVSYYRDRYRDDRREQRRGDSDHGGRHGRRR
jgi:hypothetical protein